MPRSRAAPRGSPLEVDGRRFTVERTNSIQLSGNGESPCDGGGSVDYLTIAVNVSVSWTDTGQTHAVESNTLLTPVKGVEGDVGYIAAKLTELGGWARGTCRLSPPDRRGRSTQYTAADGCAVFMLSTAGDYTLELDSRGYVNQEGFRNAEKTVTLEKGKLKVFPFSYERSAGVHVTYGTAPGHVLPTPLPGLTLFSSGLPYPARFIRSAGSNPASVRGLWPYSSGYSVSGGTCDENDPALDTTGHPRPVPFRPAGRCQRVGDLAAGDPATVGHRSAGDEGKWTGSHSWPHRRTPADATRRDLTFTLGTTSGGGYLNASLPAGSWLVEPGRLA